MIYHPRVRLKKQYTARGPYENDRLTKIASTNFKKLEY